MAIKPSEIRYKGNPPAVFGLAGILFAAASLPPEEEVVKFLQYCAIGASASGISVSLAPAAHAQQTGVRAKIGIYRPSADNVASKTNILGEADFVLPKVSDGKYVASVGYTTGRGQDGKLTVVPVTIGHYFQAPNPASSVTGNVYYGVGVGPYWVKAERNGTTDSKVTIGGYGVVGYQFPKQYFLEAKYHVAGKVNGVNPGGLAIAIGKSF